MKKFIKNFKKEWRLHLLVLVPTIHWLIFHYIPIYGIQISFRDYKPGLGILGSEWVGFRWYKMFLSDPKFLEVFLNTLKLSLYSFATFPFSIIMALFLNAMQKEKYRKTVQTISYMPHFISVTVFVGIIDMLLSPVSGIYGSVYKLFGGQGFPVDFKATAAAFSHIYIWSGVWQGLGWGTILYTAALSSVSQELHEAARIDGASRFKRILHIDLPAIMPTIAIQLIMRVSGLLGVGFEKVYLMQTPLNLSVSEVISTHIYKKGMNSFRNFSYGAAVGMFSTVINVTLMIIANQISRKISENEVSFF